MDNNVGFLDPEQEWIAFGGPKYRALEEIARRLRQSIIAEKIDPNAAIKYARPFIYLKFKIAYRCYEIRIAEHEPEINCSDFNLIFGEGPNIDDAMEWVRNLYLESQAGSLNRRQATEPDLLTTVSS